ncbi:MAG: hypothetical protein ACK58M_07915 [Acidobacteriota bacterium]|nr:hypothetical protein [Bryobacteraceae bacterium CoA2 C42]MCA2966372.1 hypothetical protein [Acidobacteriaceae bacterium]
MGIRTTIVLDEDVLERVRERAREEDVPFRVKLNDLLRYGLAREVGGQRLEMPRRTFSMGECRLPFPLRVSDLDAWEEQAAGREG